MKIFNSLQLLLIILPSLNFCYKLLAPKIDRDVETVSKAIRDVVEIFLIKQNFTYMTYIGYKLSRKTQEISLDYLAKLKGVQKIAFDNYDLYKTQFVLYWEEFPGSAVLFIENLEEFVNFLLWFKNAMRNLDEPMIQIVYVNELVLVQLEKSDLLDLHKKLFFLS